MIRLLFCLFISLLVATCCSAAMTELILTHLSPHVKYTLLLLVTSILTLSQIPQFQRSTAICWMISALSNTSVSPAG